MTAATRRAASADSRNVSSTYRRVAARVRRRTYSANSSRWPDQSDGCTPSILPRNEQIQATGMYMSH